MAKEKIIIGEVLYDSEENCFAILLAEKGQQFKNGLSLTDCPMDAPIGKIYFNAAIAMVQFAVTHFPDGEVVIEFDNVKFPFTIEQTVIHTKEGIPLNIEIN